MTERNYIVYFSLYGKKMKTIIIAKDEAEAKQKLFEKIVFHKIEKSNDDEFNKAMDMMDDIMNVLK